LQRWAAFSVRHRWRVLGGWIAALVILAGVVAGAGGVFVDSFSIPGVESQQAIDLLEERFPSQAGDSAQIVVRADAGVNDPAVRPQIEALLAGRGQPGQIVRNALVFFFVQRSIPLRLKLLIRRNILKTWIGDW